VATAHSLPTHAPPETLRERQAIGRIAAVIWAAVALFGALATVGPLRFAEMDLSETRLVVVSATVIAAVTVVLPWTRLPRAFLNVLLIMMAGYITALAHASGAVQNELTMLVTFAVALAVCFLPVRTSIAQVTLIAVLLGGGLFLLDKEDAGVQALRTSLLLSVLVVLCGLVLILRSAIAEREAAVGHRIFEEDVLDAGAFGKALAQELTRAERNSRVLALVLLEVTARPRREEPSADRVSGVVGHAILERIRLEDSAGQLGGLCFGVIAPNTTGAGAAVVAQKLSEVVGDVIESAGHERASFDVATAWVDHPHHGETADQLLEAARESLRAAAVPVRA
jgi:GGDEF domain-containing protein